MGSVGDALRTGRPLTAEQGEHFSTFYRDHFPALVRVLSSSAAPTSAEDIAQDAFMALYQQWAAVSAYDAPWAWLTLVAKRMAMRRSHRDVNRKALEMRLLPVVGSPAHNSDLDAALAHLPTRQAAALVIHHALDQPMSEVAHRLGCSEPAARVLVHRSRRRIAARLTGYAGRWVSERTWTVDAVVGHLRERGAAAHIDVVVDGHLHGSGGRWALTLDEGDYLLERDDGLRLDAGKFALQRSGAVLAPTSTTGHVTLTTTVDGNILSARMVDNTTPPTDGVPDEVWMRLFLESSPFTWTRLPAATV